MVVLLLQLLIIFYAPPVPLVRVQDFYGTNAQRFQSALAELLCHRCLLVYSFYASTTAPTTAPSPLPAPIILPATPNPICPTPTPLPP